MSVGVVSQHRRSWPRVMPCVSLRGVRPATTWARGCRSTWWGPGLEDLKFPYLQPRAVLEAGDSVPRAAAPGKEDVERQSQPFPLRKRFSRATSQC